MALNRDLGGRERLTFGQKLVDVNWLLVVLLCLVASFGFAMLFSAAKGNLDPWASRQMVRFGIGLVVMLMVAMVDIRFWLRHAYTIYALALLLLVAVEVMGVVGMGAKRWVDFGLFQLQPSEVMKIALILALARYFNGIAQEDIGRLPLLLVPTAMVVAPVALILRQPDLGTAALMVMLAAALFFLAGVRIWKFAVGGLAVLAAVPLAWALMLRDYQRQRVLTYLDPERNPLGAGYHIMQSKIALGSGGVFGKGFMQGTQSQLNFLPERQTDFIFTMLAEELGLVGCLALLSLYIFILAYGVAISLRSQSQFGRLVGMGVIVTFFLYIFINIAMVTGIIPVVGAPLPLISYGGTALVTILFGFGLLISVYIHRDVAIGRRLDFDAD
ncbi:MAG: rod shape-determining protein RodA [Alphaproteobacteria bacterium]|nr:rod shape-determining protein RodA [Alphaproteobacteria bacterium]